MSYVVITSVSSRDVMSYVVITSVSSRDVLRGEIYPFWFLLFFIALSIFVYVVFVTYSRFS